jgi:hypothetical protein
MPKYRTWSTTVSDEVPQQKSCRQAATATSGGPTRRTWVLPVLAHCNKHSPAGLNYPQFVLTKGIIVLSIYTCLSCLRVS